MKRLSSLPEQDSDTESIQSFASDEAPSLISCDSESDQEQEYEKGIRIFRRKDQAEIDPSYHSDSSDEEAENTVGAVPVEWYKDYPHIGYDVNGKKIMKPAQGDELDAFLSAMDDPSAGKSVYDDVEKKMVELNGDELEMLKRIVRHEFPDRSFDPYQNTVEWFTSKTEIHPIRSQPEPKSRFIPSKREGAKIMAIARAIKKGWIVPGKKKIEKPKVYALWDDNKDEPLQEHPMHIPAPKLALPDHNESYNPPEEYLFNEKELEEWKNLDPEDRPTNFIPKKHSNLRSVAAYDRFIQERFERCLDLYLCPRMKKNKIQIDPESLIPKLPNPEDLKPFPSSLAIVYKGHTAPVRCVSVDPCGIWLASGSDDKTVCIFEVSTGRRVKTFSFDSAVTSLKWNPNKAISLLAVSCGNEIWILHPQVANQEKTAQTLELISSLEIPVSSNSKLVTWKSPSQEQLDSGKVVVIQLAKDMSDLQWHRKGDYFASVCPQGSHSSVWIHQLSKCQSQSPFKKSHGLLQKILFHPSKPLFYVATQQNIRIYNLTKQEMVKKLMTGSKWISSMDIHPGGDNLIVGTFDKRLLWFDMDLSTKPYKTLRFHPLAVRDVAYHKRYPLFASCSDDGKVNVFHGMVYHDMMQNPLIVPVKSLKAHEPLDQMGVLHIEFHPSQPWIFTCGADGQVKLFS